MNDFDANSAHLLARQVVSDIVMDQALNWLITLECATADQQREFDAWLERDPSHRTAFNKARSIWDSSAVHAAARGLSDR